LVSLLVYVGLFCICLCMYISYVGVCSQISSDCTVSMCVHGQIFFKNDHSLCYVWICRYIHNIWTYYLNLCICRYIHTICTYYLNLSSVFVRIYVYMTFECIFYICLYMCVSLGRALTSSLCRWHCEYMYMHMGFSFWIYIKKKYKPNFLGEHSPLPSIGHCECVCMHIWS